MPIIPKKALSTPPAATDELGPAGPADPTLFELPSGEEGAAAGGIAATLGDAPVAVLDAALVRLLSPQPTPPSRAR